MTYKKLIIPIFFLLWNMAVHAQVYLPSSPTDYGTNFNRIKALKVLHVPVYNGDLNLNTTDTSAQIRINNGKLQYYFAGLWNDAGSSAPSSTLDLQGVMILGSTLTRNNTITNTGYTYTIDGGTVQFTNIVTVQGKTLGNGGGNISNNTVFGNSALALNTTGNSNAAIGYGALSSNTTGSNNISLGRSALSLNTTGLNNTGVGFNALFNNTTGSQNTALGLSSAFNNTIGDSNTVVGRTALYSNNTGVSNTAVGYNALYNLVGSGNTSIGWSAGFNLLSGNRNLAIGYNVSLPLTTGNNQMNINNIFYSRDGFKLGLFTNNPISTVEINGDLRIGSVLTGSGTDSNLVINNGIVKKVLASSGGTSLNADSGFIPYANYAGAGMALTTKLKYDSVKNIIYMGSISGNSMRFGFPGAATNSAFGDSALASRTTGTYNTAIGVWALKLNTVGSSNTAIGGWTLINNTGSSNGAFGINALSANTTGGFNNAFGTSALKGNTTGVQNTSMGASSMLLNTTASNNVAYGSATLQSNNGADNAAFGDHSMFSATVATGTTSIGKNAMYLHIGGNGNVALGRSAFYNMTSGWNNIGIGDSVAVNYSSGNNGIFIGSYINAITGTGDNQMNIGNMLYTRDRLKLGIFNNNPTYNLDVTGKGRFSDSLILTNAAVVNGGFSVYNNSTTASTGVLIPPTNNPNFVKTISIDQPNMQILMKNGNTDGSGAGIQRYGGGGVGNFSLLNIWSGKTADNNGTARQGYITFQTGNTAGTLVTRLVVDSLGGILLPTLNTGITAQAMYYNTTTKEVTYGAVTGLAATKEKTSIAAVSSPSEGDEIYDTNFHAKMIYDGKRWTGYRYNGLTFQGFDGKDWVNLQKQ